MTFVDLNRLKGNEAANYVAFRPALPPIEELLNEMDRRERWRPRRRK